MEPTADRPGPLPLWRNEKIVAKFDPTAHKFLVAWEGRCSDGFGGFNFCVFEWYWCVLRQYRGFVMLGWKEGEDGYCWGDRAECKTAEEADLWFACHLTKTPPEILDHYGDGPIHWIRTPTEAGDLAYVPRPADASSIPPKPVAAIADRPADSPSQATSPEWVPFLTIDLASQLLSNCGCSAACSYDTVRRKLETKGLKPPKARGKYGRDQVWPYDLLKLFLERVFPVTLPAAPELGDAQAIMLPPDYASPG